MLARRKKGTIRLIKKGIRFNKFGMNVEPEIVKIPLPKIVTISLKQGFGGENPPLVKKGDEVKAGQIIGRDDKSICSPVHASVSGKVIDIVEINYIHEYSKENLREKIRAIKIETSEQKLEKSLEGAGPEWTSKDPAKIRQLLYLGGASCLGQTGIPTEYASSPFSYKDVKNIIINGVLSEPFVYFTVKFPQEIEKYKTGLEILAYTFPHAMVHLVVDKNTSKQFKSWAGFRDGIKIYSVEPKHPQGLSQALIESLFDDKLPYGTPPLNKGILILPAETPLIVYQIVVEGKPFIRKRLSIGGSAVKKQVVVDVPIGSLLKDVMEPFIDKETGYRLIIGGALTGSYQEDLFLPVGKEIDSIVVLKEKKEREFLSFIRPGFKKSSYSRAFLSSLIPTKEREADVNLHGEKRPCISCGFCEQVCPVDILPYQIYRCFTHGFIDEVQRLKPLECIDCGLCSYVCPSKLPLGKILKECKSELSGKPELVSYEKKKERLQLARVF